jgi:origin recognition complex subunit 1
MPHSADPATSRKRVSRAERARRYLSGSGVVREDSDDELGLEDLPWEWIYGGRHQSREETHDYTTDECEVATTSLNPLSTSRKRKGRHGSLADSEREIVGARMGSFECRVGDCVLLKAEGNNEAWVGLICEFIEDEDEGKVANFMWFSTEKEIRNKEKKRTDFMQVFGSLLLPVFVMRRLNCPE